eukprot:GGOE01045343.1.p1 GENE.GGOE01045343.1~~GGOE01045343.1.p1  ORF type:complete len:684 (-),score=123.38 GGOE01045343.1:469-2520(-)
MSRSEVVDEFDPKTGKLVAQFYKGRLLGKGGFAKCFEFTNVENGRVYACKLIEKKSLTKPKTQQKLKSEIKIHSGLRHHNVVRFERFFEDAENVYILLELCTQQTMMELQKRKKRLSEQEAVYLMRQTLEGVKYMHDKNIIHRDLKLGNLFLSENMEVKVGDFGLAAQLEFDGERKLTVCGTPNYIAPEVLDGGKHGHSFEVDVWSLGVILYTLLVGKPPFETNDIKMTYHKIRNTSYSFPEGIEISSCAKRLIQRILQSNPESRPSLSDIMHDPFFVVNDVPRTCPLTLLPHRQPWEKEVVVNKYRVNSAGAPVESKARDPLKPITNLGMDPRQVPSHAALQSPRNVRSASPNPVRPTTDTEGFCRRAASEKDLGRAREVLLPVSSRHDLLGSDQKPPSGPCGGTTAAALQSTPGTFPVSQCPPVAVPNNDVHLDVAGQKKCPDFDDDDKQNLTQMHANLSICIQQTRADGNIATTGLPKPCVWVTEYSDFTAKYGLAYKLSYGHTGAAFNDGTKMVWDSEANRVDYISRNRDKAMGRSPEERTVCSVDDYPEALKKKVTLITYFRSYFSKYRTKNVTYPIVQANPGTNDYKPQGIDVPLVYVKQWMKHSHAMVFRLSNKCFQVSFFDGTDILLSSEAKMVTYTDRAGQSRTFALEMGRIPQPEIAERLEYTQKILYQIMHK